MARLKHKLTEPPLPPERGVKAATFRLLLDTAMDADPAGRPRPLGGRGRGALEGLARDGLPLLPEPQRARHRGDRRVARPGARVRARPTPTAASACTSCSSRPSRASRSSSRRCAPRRSSRSSSGRSSAPACSRRSRTGAATACASSSTRSRRSRRRCRPPVRDRLHRALSVVYGIEPYVVLKDIWGAARPRGRADRPVDGRRADRRGAARCRQGAATPDAKEKPPQGRGSRAARRTSR